MANVLLGVGNRLRADDGIGCHISENLNIEGWKSIDGGTVPENFTSLIRKENPNFVVIVDSAEMDLDAGEFRIIPKEKIGKLKMTTHSMPLTVLISYLESFVEKVVLIGVQPKIIEDKEGISEELKKSAEEIIKTIYNKKINEIKTH